MNLDFSFLNWDVVSSFIVKGLLFSVQLTQKLSGVVENQQKE